MADMDRMMMNMTGMPSLNRHHSQRQNGQNQVFMNLKLFLIFLYFANIKNMLQ